ncbi:hypothetical protein ScPMuIL_010910, partial [Solemya velum]
KLDTTGHRWISALGTYDFDLIYKTGRTNIDADCMSRHPINRIPPEGNPEAEIIKNDSIRAICK